MAGWGVSITAASVCCSGVGCWGGGIAGFGRRALKTIYCFFAVGAGYAFIVFIPGILFFAIIQRKLFRLLDRDSRFATGPAARRADINLVVWTFFIVAMRLHLVIKRIIQNNHAVAIIVLTGCVLRGATIIGFPFAAVKASRNAAGNVGLRFGGEGGGDGEGEDGQDHPGPLGHPSTGGELNDIFTN